MKARVITGILAVIGGIGMSMLLITMVQNSQAETPIPAYASMVHTESITYDKADTPFPSSQPVEEPEPVQSEPVQSEPEPQSDALMDRVYDVPLDGDVQEYILELCDQYDMDPVLVLAMMYVETRFDPAAVSKTGDYGLMQINKVNHEGYRKILGITDFLDAKQGALAGIYMLWDLREHYGCDTENKILMAYNRGIGGAKKLWKQGIYSNTYTEEVAKAKKTIRKFS